MAIDPAHIASVPPRYMLRKAVGKGVSSVVYLADDLQAGRRVAVKISRQALHPDYLAHVKQDFAALTMLHHPNLCRVYDFDYNGYTGIALLVMEYIKGRDFVSANTPLDRDLLVARLIQILHALRYIHENGFLYRDLKSENILVDPSGKVKLVDFGIAVTHRAAERETRAGSLHYCAPEVLQGNPPDARSDLYSLGVLLYRVMTGGYPFPGERANAVIQRILHEPYVPVQQADARVPFQLVHLVDALLHRDPAKRLASADAALELLQSGEQGEYRYMINRGFFARGDEVARVQALLAAKNRYVVTITGEMGCGKSVFLRHIKSLAQLQGYATIYIAAQFLNQEPGAFLARLLRSMEGQARFFAHFQRIKDLRRQLDTKHPISLAKDIIHLVSDLTAGIPLAILVDDMSKASARDISLLFGHIATDTPVVICLTADELPKAFVDVLAGPDRLYQVVLTNMNTQQIARFARSLVPTVHLSEPLLADLHAKTGGNPLLAVEILQEWIGQWDGSSTRQLSRTLPASIRHILDNRLAGLSPDAHLLLDLLAVADYPLPLSLQTSLPPCAQNKAIAELCASGLVRRTQVSLEVKNRLFSAQLRRRLPANKEKTLHGRLAAFLESTGFSESNAIHLAYHYAMSGQVTHLAFCYRQARKLVHSAPWQCARLLRQLIRLIDKNHGLFIDMHLTLIQALAEAYELDELHSLQKELLPGLRGWNAVRIRLKLLYAYLVTLGRHERAQPLLDTLQQAFSSGYKEHTREYFLFLVLRFKHRLRYKDSNLPVLKEEIESLKVHIANMRLVTLADDSLAGYYFMSNDYTRAVDIWKKSLKTWEILGDTRGQISATHNLGLCYGIMKQYDQARQNLSLCLKLDHAQGYYLDSRFAYNSLGYILQMDGHLRQALSHLRKSLRLAKRVDDHAEISTILYNLLVASLLSGKYGDAYHYADRFRRRFANLPPGQRKREFLSNQLSCSLALAYLVGDYSRVEQLYTGPDRVREHEIDHMAMAGALFHTGRQTEGLTLVHTAAPGITNLADAAQWGLFVVPICMETGARDVLSELTLPADAGNLLAASLGNELRSYLNGPNPADLRLALEAYQKIGDVRAIARVYYRLAKAYSGSDEKRYLENLYNARYYLNQLLGMVPRRAQASFKASAFFQCLQDASRT